MTHHPNEMYRFCLDPDLIKATVKIPFLRKLGNGIKERLLNDRKTLWLVRYGNCIVIF